MLTVHFATVGKSRDAVVNGLRAYPAIDHLVLLHSRETLEAARGIAKWFMDTAGPGECELEEISQFDLEDVVARIVQLGRRFEGANILINITGGTKVMSPAALLGAFIIGAEAYYIKEAPKTGPKPSLRDLLVRLPIPKIPWREVSATQRRILRELLSSGGRLTMANTTLAHRIGLSPQNTSHHLKEMARKERDLVRISRPGKYIEVELTGAGRLYANLVPDSKDRT